GMSQGELIELQELSLEDRIELASEPPPPPPRTPRLERVNALRISPGKVPELLNRVRIIRLLGDGGDPQLTEEAGEGHDFQPCTHTQPTWCDLCGDFIWGLYKQSLRCTREYLSHFRCPVLNWNSSTSSELLLLLLLLLEDTIETDTNVDTEEDLNTWGENKQTITSASFQSRVKVPESFIGLVVVVVVKQNKDGSYTGFIKVQFKLVRPVSVPPPRKGAAGQDPRKGAGVKRRTSFYLPRDTAKHLHISSRTRAREVIEALLNKFTVVDNPRKFALFERTERHDQ
uniref:Ras association domain family member 1 n=1 Tax=Lepisosteus oculatus TaxID=7918 RepID=W5NA69_LEPOC